MKDSVYRNNPHTVEELRAKSEVIDWYHDEKMFRFSPAGEIKRVTILTLTTFHIKNAHKFLCILSYGLQSV
jgi:hypothetical protein